MNRKQNNIFKVIRFYDPNNSKQRLTNYYRGKKGSKNITYIDYITRKQACILKALPEKALQENRELNEFMLESRSEWRQKWLNKGVSEEFLKASENIFDDEKYSKYGWNFKTKLFNSLNEAGHFQNSDFIARESTIFNLTQETEQEMLKELLEIDRERSRRQKSIEEYKKVQWGTGLYTNQAHFKTKGSYIFGELSKQEVQNLKNEFLNMRNNNDRLMWDTVLSFDTEFAEDNNILVPEVIGKLISKNIDQLFIENNLDPKRMSWGFSMHGNTSNPHAHLFFYENEPNRNGEWKFKGNLNQESMKYFYQRIELNAQTNELSYQKMRVLELETKALISEEISGQFFLSKHQQFLIHKQIKKIDELSLKIKDLELNFRKRYLSEQLTVKEKQNHNKNIKSMKNNLINNINLIHESHSKNKLKQFFERRTNLTEIEKQIAKKVDSNMLFLNKINTWEKLKCSMVKTQKLLNHEHISWFETMKTYRTKKGSTLSFNTLNDEGKIEAISYVENIIKQSKNGTLMLQNIQSKVDDISHELTKVLLKKIDDNDTKTIQTLKTIDALDKLNLKINSQSLYNNLSENNLTKEQKETLIFNEVKNSLMNGENGYYSKHVNVLFNEIYNQNFQLGIKKEFKENKFLTQNVSKISNSISDAFKLGSRQAAYEFENEMKRLKMKAENEIEKYERERIRI
ncbi:hypothetical protein EELLY_v1c03760 [Entomoplasma ellychniae]|uniref:Uncharacterized protein n=1 Tax=Entomoplasma ellychniae TaxID=2114 RepID=A0A8E2QXX4_9MOLU|nr:relaxase MobL [Entomoplasma ellychniae]PPE04343.1 hypothetical protein EELLY_v1c00170 [Entomoplasma ellychniae]PPE04625.1 hypothetical protein EELLY_v1c03050 [Entomoplasma ellychniae]PPE04696.1 hypothetical protein EELLY_v1c03760 [Entomoplasma ellychniae]